MAAKMGAKRTRKGCDKPIKREEGVVSGGVAPDAGGEDTPMQGDEVAPEAMQTHSHNQVEIGTPK